MNNEVIGSLATQTATVKQQGRFSPVWLIPIVAAGLVVYLAYTSFAKSGPRLTLNLSSADGLSVGQTEIKHKAVTLGTVEDIHLSPDMKSVVVSARMVGGTESILTDHARFWVVRPRIAAGSLTGLETLVSGAYIEVDPGLPGGQKQKVFTALKQPPGRQSDEPGQVFALKAKRLGSLTAGTPIYYRDVEVGEVLSYDLGQGLGPVSLRIFVRAPFDRFVHPQTRFWNASGLSVTMGPEGMHFELQSIPALLSGSVSFETPRDNENDPPAEESTTFDLYDDKATADAAFYSMSIPYVTYFRTSVQGLSPGSPVQLFGVQVGSVCDVKLVYDSDKQTMVARVAFMIQPERILSRGEPPNAMPEELRKSLGGTGLSVVLESSNLVTGSKDLALVYTPTKTPSDAPREGEALVLPSRGGGLESLTSTLNDVATKVDKLPFEQIGQRANAALESFRHLVAQIDSDAAPALARLPAIAQQLSEATQKANGALGPAGYGQNSEFERNVERLMKQMNDAARSFRVLADYLDRHPESLIRGRASQAVGP